MKKYVFVFLLFSLSANIFPQKISFSVIADPQISWIDTDVKSIRNRGSVFGFNVGLVFDRFFTENYAFSTGIFLWNTGGKLSHDDTTTIRFRSGDEGISPNTIIRYRLQYLTIPFALKLNSNQIGYFTLFAHLGVNNHINIKKTADVPDLNIDNVGIPDEINFYSMSYFFGGGFEYSLGGNTSLVSGIYYTHGFWDVTTSSEYRATLGAISLRLGIRF